MSKLGLIAGAGGLPHAIVSACRAAKRPLFVVRLVSFADSDLGGDDGADAGLAELGKVFKLLRKAGCDAVCLAGGVARPDFAALRPDLRGLTALPGAVAAARRGDDALLRFMLDQFEQEGFRIEGPDEVVAGLTLGEGPLGRHAPKSADLDDIAVAMRAARALGRLDIGQAVVAARGLVLAAEAQEGTDAMLRRCAELPTAIRGAPGALAGVLAKAPKPIQDRRVDLPTMGVETVVAAARAGLAGIVGEAGALLVVEREQVVAKADELGLFIVGLPPAGDDRTDAA